MEVKVEQGERQVAKILTGARALPAGCSERTRVHVRGLVRQPFIYPFEEPISSPLRPYTHELTSLANRLDFELSPISSSPHKHKLVAQLFIQC